MDRSTDLDITRRERDVLIALCRPAASSEIFVEPASVRQIAQELVVTDAAVKQHLQHLYDKFAIPESEPRRRLALAREALRREAVSRPDTTKRSPESEDPVDAAREGGGRVSAVQAPQRPPPPTRYVDSDGVKIA